MFLGLTLLADPDLIGQAAQGDTAAGPGDTGCAVSTVSLLGLIASPPRAWQVKVLPGGSTTAVDDGAACTDFWPCFER